VPITIDFSRPPTAKEYLKLDARLQRLDRAGQRARIDRIYDSMGGELPATGLVIRSGFSFRDQGIDQDASDRSAPPRDLRPPATRLMSSRGAALRFELTLVALVQTKRKPGARAKLIEFGYEVRGTSRTRGWTDLLASDATDSNRAGVLLTARDKRARSVRNALLALSDAGLVDIAGGPGERDRYEQFVLLNERGVEVLGEAEEYRVPTKSEPTFALPNGFVKNGWLQVLEDSEIAVLLMVACAKGGWWDRGGLVVPPDVRLRNYGIHRDVYSSARKTLDWFGLLRVDEVGRHPDGRAENGEQHTHRLGLRPEGFDASAVVTVIDALKGQLARR
jgi:hypothetical protein